MKKNTEENQRDKAERVPLYNLKQLTDKEWNALAYRNYLERKVVLANAR